MQPRSARLSEIQRVLGANVRRHRVARGLTQASFADRVGIEPQYLQRIEAGRASPSLAMIVAMADVLEIPLGAFFRRVLTPPQRRPGRPRKRRR